MESLDNSITRQLQHIELEMLSSIIDVCKRLNIKYYLMGGTMLGAIRHQGFIPWDDDIDIGMLRVDYDKFISKAQKLLPSHLFLQTNETDGWPANFAKIRNNDTTFIETSVRLCNINHGIYIDIFPLDFYPENRIKQKIFDIKNTLAIKRINLIFDVKMDKRWDLKSHFINCLSRVLYPTVKCAIKKREELFKSCKSSRLVANHCGAWRKKEVAPLEWFGEGCEKTFEGLVVTVPTHYDKWLTQVYGDYMKLPPEERRTTHHFTEIIDFNRPYTMYCTEERGES